LTKPRVGLYIDFIYSPNTQGVPIQMQSPTRILPGLFTTQHWPRAQDRRTETSADRHRTSILQDDFIQAVND